MKAVVLFIVSLLALVLSSCSMNNSSPMKVYYLGESVENRKYSLTYDSKDNEVISFKLYNKLSYDLDFVIDVYKIYEYGMGQYDCDILINNTDSNTLKCGLNTIDIYVDEDYIINENMSNTMRVMRSYTFVV